MLTRAIVGIRFLMAAILVGLAVPAAPAQAQGARQQATRAELEALVATLASRTDSAGRASLAAVQTRLRDGDFREGDRIYLRVIEDPALTDSFTVRAGGRLELPNVPPIDLTGVLRSELEGRLREEIAKVLRSPQVTATSFIRVSILGAVTRPGFYQVPAETPVSQAIMLAGGLAPNARVEKSEIRRGVEVVVSKDATRQLFASGQSLDQANIRAGDEIVVGQRGGGSTALFSAIGALSGVLFLVITAL
jgi:hypothetical protein